MQRSPLLVRVQYLNDMSCPFNETLNQAQLVTRPY